MLFYPETICHLRLGRSGISLRHIVFWSCQGWLNNVEHECGACFRPRGGSSRRAAGRQLSLKNVRQKIPPNGQTRLKFGFCYEISQHNHFRYFRHHFGSTFPRNPTKPMFRSFPTTPLMRWRFQHNCRWIWRFRDCLRHSHKGKKPNNRLQET